MIKTFLALLFFPLLAFGLEPWSEALRDASSSRELSRVLELIESEPPQCSGEGKGLDGVYLYSRHKIDDLVKELTDAYDRLDKLRPDLADEIIRSIPRIARNLPEAYANYLNRQIFEWARENMQRKVSNYLRRAEVPDVLLPRIALPFLSIKEWTIHSFQKELSMIVGVEPMPTGRVLSTFRHRGLYQALLYLIGKKNNPRRAEFEFIKSALWDEDDLIQLQAVKTLGSMGFRFKSIGLLSGYLKRTITPLTPANRAVAKKMLARITICAPFLRVAKIWRGNEEPLVAPFYH